MNATVCLLLYGIAMIWLGPPVLNRLTRSGSLPQLAVAAWLIALAATLTAWAAVVVGLVLDTVSGARGSEAGAWCIDALLSPAWTEAPLPLGGVLTAIVVALSSIAGRRSVRRLRRLRSASVEHADAARILGRPGGPSGVVMVSAPHRAAYCVAGDPHAIVVTTAAMASLDPDQLAAVIAHEEAHLRGRHPQILMGVRALGASLSLLPLFRAAPAALARLLEMCADDAAVRRVGVQPLLGGLINLIGAPPATGAALGAANTAVVARVSRLAVPPSRAAEWRRHLALTLSIGVMLASPAAILLICHA